MKIRPSKYWFSFPIR